MSKIDFYLNNENQFCLVIGPIAAYCENKLEKFGFTWKSKKIKTDWFGSEFTMNKNSIDYEITLGKIVDDGKAKVFIEWQDNKEKTFRYELNKFNDNETLAAYLAEKIDVLLCEEAK